MIKSVRDRCTVCGEPFDAADEIQLAADHAGQWIHKECAPTYGRAYGCDCDRADR